MIQETNQANQASMPTSSLPTKHVYCYRSGVLLAEVKALCSNGWPFLNAGALNEMYHPVYSYPLEKLLVRIKEQLLAAEQTDWSLTDREMQEIALSMSAIMYGIDGMWQPHADAHHKLEATLPNHGVVVGSAARLLNLASWYHYATSKRMSFPLYRPSKLNDNTDWKNFGAWLDDALSIKEEWEAGRTQHERDELLKRRTEALLTVKAENVYKRIDFNKVWNWIDIQLVQDGRYPLGRRETFKTIFMKGDTSPEDWILDDVEDLQLAIIECCDTGNEITFFINSRLNAIKSIIQDFYSSFTLLTHSVTDTVATQVMTSNEQAKTNEFFATYDKKLADLAANGLSLPSAPKREQFASLALFLKAQAEWNILNRRKQALDKAATATQQGEQA
jgi:hypothetical protein